MALAGFLIALPIGSLAIGLSLLTKKKDDYEYEDGYAYEDEDEDDYEYEDEDEDEDDYDDEDEDDENDYQDENQDENQEYDDFDDDDFDDDMNYSQKVQYAEFKKKPKKTTLTEAVGQDADFNVSVKPFKKSNSNKQSYNSDRVINKGQFVKTITTPTETFDYYDMSDKQLPNVDYPLMPNSTLERIQSYDHREYDRPFSNYSKEADKDILPLDSANHDMMMTNANQALIGNLNGEVPLERSWTERDPTQIGYNTWSRFAPYMPYSQTANYEENNPSLPSVDTFYNNFNIDSSQNYTVPSIDAVVSAPNTADTANTITNADAELPAEYTIVSNDQLNSFGYAVNTDKDMTNVDLSLDASVLNSLQSDVNIPEAGAVENLEQQVLAAVQSRNQTSSTRNVIQNTILTGTEVNQGFSNLTNIPTASGTNFVTSGVVSGTVENGTMQTYESNATLNSADIAIPAVQSISGSSSTESYLSSATTYQSSAPTNMTVSDASIESFSLQN